MVRRNTEQQLDALIEPVRARVQQLESQMSTDPRDPLTAEYTKAKNMLNAYETIRDHRLREIDKMYGMAYTENEKNRANWREFNEKTDFASDTRTGEITDIANQTGAYA